MRLSILTPALCLCSLVTMAQTNTGQASSSAPPSAQPPAASGQRTTAPKARSRTSITGPTSGQIADNTPVITLQGLCPATAPKPKPGSTAKAAPCKTVVTKAQMERLIETIRPNLPPNQRRSVAEQYAMLLTVANAGAKAGVEKDPKVQEELRISRLQILASSYSRQLSQESSEVLPAEIQKHYKDNAAQYEEAKLLRIYVPMTSNAEGKPGDPAASKTLADKIRQRAAAGEDFEKLQKDAFTEANNKGTPPAIDLGERRRGTLPPKQESSIFELKPGEISPAFEESTGFYIYKLVSKETVPLDKVKDEIKNTIARERFKETMDKLRASVKPTFNEAYFGTAPTPAAMPQPAPAAPQTPASAQAPSPSPAATPAQPPSSAEAPKTNPPDTAK